MNKKQVKALLSIMSKDSIRPVLQTALLDTMPDGRKAIIATDGRVLAAYNIDDIDDNDLGKTVSRKALERWYKLAERNDVLDGTALGDLIINDSDNQLTKQQWPEWEKLIQTKFAATETVTLDPELLRPVRDLAGTVGVTMKFTGRYTPVVVETDKMYAVIAPMVR